MPHRAHVLAAMACVLLTTLTSTANGSLSIENKPWNTTQPFAPDVLPLRLGAKSGSRKGATKERPKAQRLEFLSVTGFVKFDYSSVALHARAWSMPQTASRKKRNARTRRKSATASKSGGATQTPRPQTAPPTSTGPLAQMTYELPLKRPKADEAQAQGLLTRLDCDAKGVTFNIQATGRVLKLRTPDLNKIILTTYTPDVSGDLTCGARRPANNVVVIYRPSKGTRTPSDGELLAVEFVPRNFELKKE